MLYGVRLAYIPKKSVGLPICKAKNISKDNNCLSNRNIKGRKKKYEFAMTSQKLFVCLNLLNLDQQKMRIMASWS